MSDENQQPGNNATVQESEEQPDFSVKHPLERRWTLWYDSKTKKSAASWNDALRAVCTVSTVEEFWWSKPDKRVSYAVDGVQLCSLFNNILSPADLDDRSSIFFFLDGIKPDWDEKETAAGGVWTVPVKQRGQEGKSKLEAYWADVVLHMLGEQFENGEDICGVACDIRKQDRVVLWTKTANDEALQISLGKQLKSLLKIPTSVSIGYVSHAQAKKEARGAKEDTYTV